MLYHYNNWNALNIYYLLPQMCFPVQTKHYILALYSQRPDYIWHLQSFYFELCLGCLPTCNRAIKSRWFLSPGWDKDLDVFMTSFSEPVHRQLNSPAWEHFFVPMTVSNRERENMLRTRKKLWQAQTALCSRIHYTDQTSLCSALTPTAEKVTFKYRAESLRCITLDTSYN